MKTSHSTFLLRILLIGLGFQKAVDALVSLLFPSAAYRVRRMFGFLCAMAVILPEWETTRAGVELQPGTMIEFATLEQGRTVLGARDDFTQVMSQFDRCVRMKTSKEATEAQYLSYIQDQVLSWSVREQTTLSNVVGSIRLPLSDLNLALPSIIWFIKTTGNEEARAAYTRGNAIIVPQPLASGSSTTLRTIVSHELFHVHSRHVRERRAALYGIVGFQACPRVSLPQSLLDLTITNPDACPDEHNFFIHVQLGEERLPALPVLYSSSATYTGGSLVDYLVSKLLVLEETETGLHARLSDAGQPVLVDPWEVVDYYDQTGYNAVLDVQPEEVLANNFMQLVLGTKSVTSPRVHHMLRHLLQSQTSVSPRFLAGRFESNVLVSDSHPHLLETSPDLLDWRVWDAFTDMAGSFQVRDRTAWLGGNRFFRARPGELPRLDPGDTNNLVWIPPGTFVMGSPTGEAGRASIDGPQGLVTLTHGFWIGRCEVTQNEYQQVMGTNPSSYVGIGCRPVESVPWTEAVAYCEQLTLREQEAGRLLSGHVYRLPTEAEWEYAARAGSTSRYSFGDDPDYIECFERFWCSDNAGRQPRPVGLMPPNVSGMHDVHGNVAEWCQDWYAPYGAGTVTDPQGPATGTWRITRGGGLNGSPSDCRSAARNYAPPNTGFYAIGFRVVLAPTGTDLNDPAFAFGMESPNTYR